MAMRSAKSKATIHIVTLPKTCKPGLHAYTLGVVSGVEMLLEAETKKPPAECC